MKRIVGLTLLLLLVGLYFDTTCAETHRLKLLKSASINAFQLAPGQYKLILNGAQEVEIYDGRKLVATAKFEMVPLGGALPNTVLQTETGELKEIRFKKTRIVFKGSVNKVHARR